MLRSVQYREPHEREHRADVVSAVTGRPFFEKQQKREDGAKRLCVQSSAGNEPHKLLARPAATQRYEALGRELC